MVTRDDAQHPKGASNPYEFNARSVLALYGQFVEGDVDSTLAVISARTLSDAARSALSATAERLGYGAGACSWITLGGEGEEATEPDDALGAADLRTLIEGLDPVAIITVDAAASSALSDAYDTSLKLDSLNRVFCRNVAAISDFEAALTDTDYKRKVWAVLKRL